MLVHADPFSHYAAGEHLRVYPASGSVGGGAGPYGRGGGAAFRFSGNFSDFIQRNALGVVGATGIYEADFSVSIAPPQDNVVLAFVDSGTIQCSLVLTTALRLAVYRGAFIGGTLLGTLAYTLTLGTLVHLSWKAVIGNSGSTVLDVWEDDDVTPSATLTLTSVDTQNTGAAQWNALHLGAGCSGDTTWSHLVVMDGSGFFLNDLIGPVDVWALRANARVPGTTQQWVPSAGTAHIPLYADGTPDDDLFYAYQSSPGQLELAAVDPVPYPDRAILGMELYACARRAGAGTPTVAPTVRDTGINYAATAQSPDAAYAYAMQPYSRMPGGATFSAAAFDALQWGLEKAS